MITTEPLLLIMAAGNLWLAIIAMDWLTPHIVAASYSEPPATMIMTERPEQRGPCIHRRNPSERKSESINPVPAFAVSICSTLSLIMSHSVQASCLLGGIWSLFQRVLDCFHLGVETPRLKVQRLLVQVYIQIRCG